MLNKSEAFNRGILNSLSSHIAVLNGSGEIIAVNEYPQQFIATVLYKKTEIMFPLNEDIIVEIDDEEETILVNLPEGLLDVYLT